MLQFTNVPKPLHLQEYIYTYILRTVVNNADYCMLEYLQHHIYLVIQFFKMYLYYKLGITKSDHVYDLRL